MSNDLTTTNQNAKLALTKSKNLLDITNKLLAKRSQQEIVENWNNLRLSVSLGHEDTVSNVIFTPDCNYILSASCDGTMKLWDIHTGREVRLFEGNSKRITSIAITNDGKYVVSGGEGNEIILWNLYTGEKIRKFYDDNYIPEEYTSTIIHVIGDSIISMHWGGYQSWNIKTGEIITNSLSGIFYDPNRSAWPSFSPDGAMVVTFDDNKGSVWDVQSGEEIRTLNGGASSSRFTPDGKYIISKNSDSITLWDAKSGEIVREFESDKYYVSDNGEVYIDDDDDDSFYKTGSMLAFDITPDGNYLISGHSNGVLIIRDIQSGEIIKGLNFESMWVGSIAIDFSGKYMAVSGENGIIMLWNLNSLEEIRIFNIHSDRTEDINISEDGKHIVLSYKYGRTKTFDIYAGRETNKSQKKPTSENKYSVLSLDKTIKLIDMENGQEVRCYEGHTEKISFVAITPDNNYVVSVSERGTVKIWDLYSKQEIRTFDSEFIKWSTKISVTHDSHYIAIEDGSSITFWDLYSGEMVNTIKLYGYTAGYMTSNPHFFDFNEKYIVLNPKARALHLLDLTSGKLLSKYATFEDGKQWIAWTPNGDYTCSDGAEKYFCFVDDSKGMPEIVDASHPVYKANKKNILLNDYLSNHVETL